MRQGPGRPQKARPPEQRTVRPGTLGECPPLNVHSPGSSSSPQTPTISRARLRRSLAPRAAEISYDCPQACTSRLTDGCSHLRGTGIGWSSRPTPCPAAGRRCSVISPPSSFTVCRCLMFPGLCTFEPAREAGRAHPGRRRRTSMRRGPARQRTSSAGTRGTGISAGRCRRCLPFDGMAISWGWGPVWTAPSGSPSCSPMERGWRRSSWIPSR